MKKTTNSGFPDIQLTLHQELTIANIKLQLPKMKREDIEEHTLEIIRQRFAYENAFKAELNRNFSR